MTALALILRKQDSFCVQPGQNFLSSIHDAEHRKARGASEIDVTAWQERRAGTYTQ